MKPERPEEEEFVGELHEKNEEEKEDNLTVEQRMHWFEAIDAFTDRLKEIDPALTMELDDDAILNMSRWPLEPIHRIPAIVIHHPELDKPVGNLSTSSKDVDVEKFRQDLDRLTETIKRRYDKAMKKAERK